MEKILFGSALLMVAAIGAYASAQMAVTNAYYKVNPGTPTENCISVQIQKDCQPGPATCVEFIQAVGSVLNMWETAVPIAGTERFKCEGTLEEIQ